MERDELRRVARDGIPVIYRSKAYGYRILGQVTAIIERYIKGRVYLRAELKDIRANSVYICDPEELEIWDGTVEN